MTKTHWEIHQRGCQEIPLLLLILPRHEEMGRFLQGQDISSTSGALESRVSKKKKPHLEYWSKTSQICWLSVLALSFSCVTSSKSYNLLGPQFSHKKNENNNIYLQGCFENKRGNPCKALCTGQNTPELLILFVVRA